MSFLERSRMRGIAGGNDTFHHPKCRNARPEWGWPRKSGSQFARCCMFDFYADEQTDDAMRNQAKEAIKNLEWAGSKGYLPDDLVKAASGEVNEQLKVKIASRWDHGQKPPQEPAGD